MEEEWSRRRLIRRGRRVGDGGPPFWAEEDPEEDGPFAAVPWESAAGASAEAAATVLIRKGRKKG